MNAKRIGFIILAVFVLGLSYWVASNMNDTVKSVKVDPERHTLVVMSNDAIISKRLLGMKQYGDEVYFLGYEGYGIYNVRDNTIRLWPVIFKGNHIEPGNVKNYQKGVKTVNTVKSFLDFSYDEQQRFGELLDATDRGAHYYKPYYQSGYETSLIDLDKRFFITNNVKSIKKVGHILYVLDGSGFLIIDIDTQVIQGYFNTRIIGEGTKGVPDSLKGHYGSQFIRIYALSKIEEPHLDILWTMRKQYIIKNNIDVSQSGLFPLELQDTL